MTLINHGHMDDNVLSCDFERYVAIAPAAGTEPSVSQNQVGQDGVSDPRVHEGCEYNLIVCGDVSQTTIKSALSQVARARQAMQRCSVDHLLVPIGYSGVVILHEQEESPAQKASMKGNAGEDRLACQQGDPQRQVAFVLESNGSWLDRHIAAHGLNDDQVVEVCLGLLRVIEGLSNAGMKLAALALSDVLVEGTPEASSQASRAPELRVRLSPLVLYGTPAKLSHEDDQSDRLQHGSSVAAKKARSPARRPDTWASTPSATEAERSGTELEGQYAGASGAEDPADSPEVLLGKFIQALLTATVTAEPVARGGQDGEHGTPRLHTARSRSTSSGGRRGTPAQQQIADTQEDLSAIHHATSSASTSGCIRDDANCSRSEGTCAGGHIHEEEANLTNLSTLSEADDSMAEMVGEQYSFILPVPRTASSGRSFRDRLWHLSTDLIRHKTTCNEVARTMECRGSTVLSPAISALNSCGRMSSLSLDGPSVEQAGRRSSGFTASSTHADPSSIATGALAPCQQDNDNPVYDARPPSYVAITQSVVSLHSSGSVAHGIPNGCKGDGVAAYRQQVGTQPRAGEAGFKQSAFNNRTGQAHGVSLAELDQLQRQPGQGRKSCSDLQGVVGEGGFRRHNPRLSAPDTIKDLRHACPRYGTNDFVRMLCEGESEVIGVNYNRSTGTHTIGDLMVLASLAWKIRIASEVPDFELLPVKAQRLLMTIRQVSVGLVYSKPGLLHEVKDLLDQTPLGGESGKGKQIQPISRVQSEQIVTLIWQCSCHYSAAQAIMRCDGFGRPFEDLLKTHGDRRAELVARTVQNLFARPLLRQLISDRSHTFKYLLEPLKAGTRPARLAALQAMCNLTMDDKAACQVAIQTGMLDVIVPFSTSEDLEFSAAALRLLGYTVDASGSTECAWQLLQSVSVVLSRPRAETSSGIAEKVVRIAEYACMQACKCIRGANASMDRVHAQHLAGLLSCTSTKAVRLAGQTIEATWSESRQQDNLQLQAIMSAASKLAQSSHKPMEQRRIGIEVLVVVTSRPGPGGFGGSGDSVPFDTEAVEVVSDWIEHDNEHDVDAAIRLASNLANGAGGSFTSQPHPGILASLKSHLDSDCNMLSLLASSCILECCDIGPAFCQAISQTDIVKSLIDVMHRREVDSTWSAAELLLRLCSTVEPAAVDILDLELVQALCDAMATCAATYAVDAVLEVTRRLLRVHQTVPTKVCILLADGLRSLKARTQWYHNQSSDVAEILDRLASNMHCLFAMARNDTFELCLAAGLEYTFRTAVRLLHASKLDYKQVFVDMHGLSYIEDALMEHDVSVEEQLSLYQAVECLASASFGLAQAVADHPTLLRAIKDQGLLQSASEMGRHYILMTLLACGQGLQRSKRKVLELFGNDLECTVFTGSWRTSRLASEVLHCIAPSKQFRSFFHVNLAGVLLAFPVWYSTRRSRVVPTTQVDSINNVDGVNSPDTAAMDSSSATTAGKERRRLPTERRMEPRHTGVVQTRLRAQSQDVSSHEHLLRQHRAAGARARGPRSSLAINSLPSTASYLQHNDWDAYHDIEMHRDIVDSGYEWPVNNEEIDEQVFGNRNDVDVWSEPSSKTAPGSDPSQSEARSSKSKAASCGSQKLQLPSKSSSDGIGDTPPTCAWD